MHTPISLQVVCGHQSTVPPTLTTNYPPYQALHRSRMFVCLSMLAARFKSGRYVHFGIAAPSEDIALLSSDELPRKEQLVVSFLQIVPAHLHSNAKSV